MLTYVQCRVETKIGRVEFTKVFIMNRERRNPKVGIYLRLIKLENKFFYTIRFTNNCINDRRFTKLVQI